MRGVSREKLGAADDRRSQVTEYLPFVVLGIANGSIYALAAMGLVLTYKTSGVFNFAHGAQAAVAAYLMFELWQERQIMPWPLAAGVAILVAGPLMGLILERIAFALQGAPPATQVAATVGVLVGLTGILVIRYGPGGLIFNNYLPARTFSLPGVTVQMSQIVVTVVSGAAACALYLFFRRARLGLAMQGVVEDPALLGFAGTNPAQVRRSAWLIGSSFAALSGILLVPTVGLNSAVLVLLVVQAFGAAAVGAFNSLPLTYLGGLIVGLTSEISKKVIADSETLARPLSALPSTLPFIILFVVLLVTKRERLIERSGMIGRRFPPPRELAAPARFGGMIVAALVVLAIPHVVGTRLSSYSLAIIFVILFASLGLLVQTSGQVSLCHLAFAAVGAATFVHARNAGLPWAIAVLLGGLTAVPLGAVVAIPAIRFSGVYLAIATFGFGILVERILFPSALMFGRQLQLEAPRPSIAQGDVAYYYVCAAVAVLSLVIVGLVRRSRLGRLLRCLADSPGALAAHGTSPSVIVVLVFCVSAFFAGLAGTLIGPVTETASGLTFGYFGSLVLLVTLFISGRQPLLAAFVAAAAYWVVPAYIDDAELALYLPVAFGGVAVLVAAAPMRFIVSRLQGSRRASERAERRPRRQADQAITPAGAS